MLLVHRHVTMSCPSQVITSTDIVTYDSPLDNVYLTSWLWPTQPPNQWVPGSLSFGVKRPGREADHSPASNAEVKEWVELYNHSPNTPWWRCA